MMSRQGVDDAKRFWTDKWCSLRGRLSGIGAETARAFAEEGARLVLHYNANRDSAEALASELDVETVVVQADVSDEGAVEAMYAKAVAALRDGGASAARLKPFLEQIPDAPVDAAEPLWGFRDDEGKTITFTSEAEAAAMG